MGVLRRVPVPGEGAPGGGAGGGDWLREDDADPAVVHGAGSGEQARSLHSAATSGSDERGAESGGRDGREAGERGGILRPIRGLQF